MDLEGATMEIHGENNFCRVFELPNTYPQAYCFGGGQPVNFQMVDWFNPIPDDDIYDGKIKKWKEYKDMLKEFLAIKTYVRPGRQYLLITDFGESFIFCKN
jgi:hypothetical protein